LAFDPFITDIVTIGRTGIHSVMVAGQHRFGIVSIMGFKDCCSISQQIESETYTRSNPVIGINISRDTFDLAPIPAKAQTGIDIQSFHHLPGILGKSF